MSVDHVTRQAMPSSKSIYDLPSGKPSHGVKEEKIQYGFWLATISL
jgi:hypothetical protein